MKMVILDRDGVINEEAALPDVRILSPDQWIAIPGSLMAIQKLHQSGHTITIATNQSGIGRGVLDTSTLESIHQKMLWEIKVQGGFVDHIYFCPHKPEDNCSCRKPKPGLLYQIIEDYDIHPSKALFVGDSLADYQASVTAKIPFGLVLTGKGAQTLQQISRKEKNNIQIFQNLLEVADRLSGSMVPN